MTTLLIDNYDSFSYNLFQYVGTIDPDIKVVRNDSVTIQDIIGMNPDRIIISPGPGRPEDAGICIDVVKELKGKFPILGVCLGHQSICVAYGATVTYASKLMHGKTSIAKLGDSVLYEGLPAEMTIGRYHSLAAAPDTIPDNLRITAVTAEGDIMAVEDSDNKVYGLQFHPESVLTPMGMDILRNFMKVTI